MKVTRNFVANNEPQAVLEATLATTEGLDTKINEILKLSDADLKKLAKIVDGVPAVLDRKFSKDYEHRLLERIKEAVASLVIKDGVQAVQERFYPLVEAFFKLSVLNRKLRPLNDLVYKLQGIAAAISSGVSKSTKSIPGASQIYHKGLYDRLHENGLGEELKARKIVEAGSKDAYDLSAALSF